jgi:hypothetical protein
MPNYICHEVEMTMDVDMAWRKGNALHTITEDNLQPRGMW